MTLLQLAAAALIQLVFMIVAPPVALYFVTVLFIIFGFASLRLRPREALVAWSAVALALAVIVVRVPGTLTVPHEDVFQRALVAVIILLTLARCTLLGLYGRQLWVLLAQRYAQAKDSLEAGERFGVSVAASLQEDLGQDLTGVSLLLCGLCAPLAPGRPSWCAGGHDGSGPSAGRNRQDAHARAADRVDSLGTRSQRRSLRFDRPVDLRRTTHGLRSRSPALNSV
jgi:hypothetical protein